MASFYSAQSFIFEEMEDLHFRHIMPIQVLDDGDDLDHRIDSNLDGGQQPMSYEDGFSRTNLPEIHVQSCDLSSNPENRSLVLFGGPSSI